MDKPEIKNKASYTLLDFYKPDRAHFAFACLATLISAATNLLIPLLVGFSIDQVLLGKVGQLSGSLAKIYERIGGRSYLLNHLWILALALISISLIRSLSEFISDTEIAKVAERGAERMRRKLFSHIQKLPYAWHAQAQTGDLVQRCTSDVETIRHFLQVQLLQLVTCFLMIVFSVSLMLSLDITLSSIVLAATPVLFISSIYYFKKRRAGFEEWDEAEGKLSSRLEENLAGMRVIKAFGRKDHELDQLSKIHKDLYDYGINQYGIMARFWSFSEFISNLELALIVIFGTLKVIEQNMTLGVLLIFVSYADRLLMYLRVLARVLADIGKSQISFGRLREILDAPLEDPDIGLKEPQLEGNIRFDHVYFQYPDGHEPVLEDINLEIKAKQKIGILGPTGSGKSSLVLLLQKLYEVDRGCLSFDGIDVREINRFCLRRQVGLILQESYIYSRSIAENIRFSSTHASDDLVRRYAKIAHLDQDIKQFNQGYDTLVGEGGVTLSGGQRQRLAIARTLIRDCPILIFDDSLSAVDTDTDREIRKSLADRPQGSTTIIISHRISSLFDADRIFVIEKGRICQAGTHSDLIKEDGLYRRVYDIQYDWVKE